MKRLAFLLLLLATCGCAGDGLPDQKEALAQPMAVPPRTSATSATPVAVEPPAGAPAGSNGGTASGTFEQLARPVLSRRCAPCHEPGGKMYDKMPFDNPDVVSSHSGGILKRLDGSDRKTVQEWLAGLPAPAPAL